MRLVDDQPRDPPALEVVGKARHRQPLRCDVEQFAAAVIQALDAAAQLGPLE
jgi:hypothetical protein